MNKIPTKIEGAYILEFHKYEDERGKLVRIFDEEFLKAQKIQMDIVQSYISYSKEKSTLRGIHCQVAPKAEKKIGRCIKGSVYEVIIDLRKESPTYKEWQGFELKADDDKSLFVPEGVGHAILILENDTAFLTLSSAPFSPECEIGVRYNDPAFNIQWPIPIKNVSEKDLSWEDFKP